MRRSRRVLFAGAVLAAFGSIGTGPVGSAEAPAAGWWWRAQTGLVAPLPAPPTVPEGGIVVSGLPVGATAVAAVRYELDEGETADVLTLRVADGSVGAAGAVIGACPAGSAWLPASGGRWDTAPTAACDLGSVNGVLSDDGTAFTFALAALAVDGVVDVVLVPGRVAGAPAGADGSTFHIGFHPPDGESLTTSSVEAEDEFDAGFAFDPSFAGSAQDTYLGDFSAPTAFSPALEPNEQVVTPSAPLNDRVLASQIPRPVRKAGGNLLGFLIAAAGLAAAYRASKQAPPPVRRLGPMAHRPVPVLAGTEPEPAGLGRFSRPRVGTPPRLH